MTDLHAACRAALDTRRALVEAVPADYHGPWRALCGTCPATVHQTGKYGVVAAMYAVHDEAARAPLARFVAAHTPADELRLIAHVEDVLARHGVIAGRCVWCWDNVDDQAETAPCSEVRSVAVLLGVETTGGDSDAS